MFDSNQFLNDLIKDVNLTDEQKAALQSTLTNPTVSKRLEEGAMRQSDYSRLSAEAQREIKMAKDYYNQLKEWEAAKQREFSESRPSDLDGRGGDPSYLPVTFKDELQTRLQTMETGAIGLTAAMTKLGLQYFKEFGKVLDVDAVIKKATDEGTNFNIAYERFVQPERDEKAKVELEERIKRERAEAASEALANASIPTNTTSFAIPGGNPHVLDTRAIEGRQFGWRAAVEAHAKDVMAGTVKHD